MRIVLALTVLLGLSGCGAPVLTAASTIAGIVADELGAVDKTIDTIQAARGKTCTAVQPTGQ
jgi:hypothetical protein